LNRNRAVQRKRSIAARFAVPPS